MLKGGQKGHEEPVWRETEMEIGRRRASDAKTKKNTQQRAALIMGIFSSLTIPSFFETSFICCGCDRSYVPWVLFIVTFHITKFS